MRKLFYIFLFTVALAISSFGQAKSISGAEYETAVYGAFDTSAKLPRKTVSVRRQYESGTISKNVEIINESLPPDNSRRLIIEKIGDVVTETEIILLKDIEYRRENKGRWVKQDLSKLKGGFKLGSEITNSESEHSVEEVAVGNEKLRVFSIQTQRGRAGNITFDERQTFIDNKGLIRKVTGRVSKNTRDNLFSDEVTTFEYNPKIKINAPVTTKKTKP